MLSAGTVVTQGLERGSDLPSESLLHLRPTLEPPASFRDRQVFMPLTEQEMEVQRNCFSCLKPYNR